MKAPQALFSYRPYWAKRFGTAPFLPMSREEMDALGWDSCDVIVVTGDAYIDHPSFGMALIGRLLEAQGFRVGIIAQPDWHSAEAFRALGRPNLYFGVTAGNMDSMVNRYTSERKIRSDDAYTPNGEGNKRPDRAVLVYSQRCREAYPTRRWCWGASRRACAVSPTTTTGPTPCAARCCRTPRRTCCCSATPSGPWWN
jgi:Fe-S oxidoreductase